MARGILPHKPWFERFDTFEGFSPLILFELLKPLELPRCGFEVLHIQIRKILAAWGKGMTDKSQAGLSGKEG